MGLVPFYTRVQLWALLSSSSSPFGCSTCALFYMFYVNKFYKDLTSLERSLKFVTSSFLMLFVQILYTLKQFMGKLAMLLSNYKKGVSYCQTSTMTSAANLLGTINWHPLYMDGWQGGRFLTQFLLKLLKGHESVKCIINHNIIIIIILS